MKILGIESSCDDTSVALLESSEAGHQILALKTASQIDVHKEFGGVVPEVAGRLHAETIAPLISDVLGNSKPDVIAVTSGPGLITGLVVGVEAARTLSAAWEIPLVATNHISGHIHSVELEFEPITQFPALALIVSGGHTELVLMRSHEEFELLGKTQDDAAGECFDKIAKLLDLPYPGGPQISKLAATGNQAAITFPRPMLNQPNFDFSFAGLKTATLYHHRNNPQESANDFAASAEQAIIDVLVGKTVAAALQYAPQCVLLAGGVAANKKLRETLQTELAKLPAAPVFRMPKLPFCMDNGAMIAAAGFWKAIKKDFTSWDAVSPDPNWRIAS
jgi:N6-L-threonylcarbamoyladenine synthase